MTSIMTGVRRTIVAAAVAAAAGFSATAATIDYDPQAEDPGAQAVEQAFKTGADEILVKIEKTLTPTALLEDTKLAPWIRRIDKTRGRVAALCKIPLRRGLSTSDSIEQLAMTMTPSSAQTDRFASAAAYDSFVFFGETRSRKQKVVRVLFTQRAIHGPLDCDGAYSLMRRSS